MANKTKTKRVSRDAGAPKRRRPADAQRHKEKAAGGSPAQHGTEQRNDEGAESPAEGP